jgi:hypothetical protein
MGIFHDGTPVLLVATTFNTGIEAMCLPGVISHHPTLVLSTANGRPAKIMSVVHPMFTAGRAYGMN